jgi:hypothetical protein
MDGWGFILAMVGVYAIVAIPILAWAAWRTRRPGPVGLHPAIPAVMLGVSAGLLGLWAVRGDWLGMISAACMMVVFGISLHTSLTRRAPD